MAPAEVADGPHQETQRRLRQKGETWTFSDWRPKGKKPNRIRAVHIERLERPERAASDSLLFFDSPEGQKLFASPLSKNTELAESKKSWQPSDSAKLYNVAGWGSPYFFVDRAGQVCVRPSGGAQSFLKLPFRTDLSRIRLGLASCSCIQSDHHRCC